MKNLIIGIIIGMAISAPIAWAASRMTLVNGQGIEIGTASNPLYIN